MDEYSAILRIIPQVIAWESVSRVDHPAKLLALDEAGVRLGTMVDLDSEEPINSHRLFEHLFHLLDGPVA